MHLPKRARKQAARKQLDSTVAALQQRHGARALRKGMPPTASRPPHIATGFPTLDALTGCRGVPLRAITILSGRMTSGKLTLAYKLLAQAQGKRQQEAVALLDLNGSSDPDYLARCGIQLEKLLLVRPTAATATLQLLIDLIATQTLRLIVVDSLPDLADMPKGRQQITTMTEQLRNGLQQSNCGLVLLDEFAPIWRRWLRPAAYHALVDQAALHLTLRRDRWLHHEGRITGYEAQATIVRSRWARQGDSAPIAIHFNGTVRAQSTW